MHVPVWHEETKAFQADGRIATVGIVQEQHPERVRLFMQWKQMKWPVLVDALNQLEVAVVPITVLIDERGIVRDIPERGADPGAVVEAFLAMPPSDTPLAERPPVPNLDAPLDGTLRTIGDDDDLESVRATGIALAALGPPGRLDDAVALLTHVSLMERTNGLAQFQVGVALRRRFESRLRKSHDFQGAVNAWGLALQLDPNQYIWRRRIQQYGPRLDKPYPFYDWVAEAQQAIETRGETPVALRVEPSGAEIARPAKRFRADAEVTEPPDPDGRIERDAGDLILIEPTVVPGTARPGSTVRVHMTFRPNPERTAHWNNEVAPMRLWLEPGAADIDRRAHDFGVPSAAVSNETRRCELEVRVPDAAAPGVLTINGYVLYYVCEGADGACLYRRQDVAVPIEVR